jgi:hypothetical protein
MADIRAYLNNKPTRVGICLTSYEFNWLAGNLIYQSENVPTYTSQRSTRSLTIYRKPTKYGGVQVIQRVEDQTRRLNLRKDEIMKIVRHYGDFYYLIEDMEDKQEQAGQEQIEEQEQEGRQQAQEEMDDEGQKALLEDTI